MKSIKYLSLVLAVLGLSFTGISSAGTLDDVRAKGHVQCGINTGLTGFAFTDDQGNWQGFDVALCRRSCCCGFRGCFKCEVHQSNW